MPENLMRDDDERLAYANSISAEQWRKWYEFEREINAETDRLIATGMHWEEAVDQAYLNMNGAH